MVSVLIILHVGGGMHKHLKHMIMVQRLLMHIRCKLLTEIMFREVK